MHRVPFPNRTLSYRFLVLQNVSFVNQSNRFLFGSERRRQIGFQLGNQLCEFDIFHLQFWICGCFHDERYRRLFVFFFFSSFAHSFLRAVCDLLFFFFSLLLASVMCVFSSIFFFFFLFRVLNPVIKKPPSTKRAVFFCLWIETSRRHNL